MKDLPLTSRCLETRKLLPYLDAQRDPAWRQQYASLANHIVHCPQCQRELKALENMLAAVEAENSFLPQPNKIPHNPRTLPQIKMVRLMLPLPSNITTPCR